MHFLFYLGFGMVIGSMVFSIYSVIVDWHINILIIAVAMAVGLIALGGGAIMSQDLQEKT